MSRQQQSANAVTTAADYQALKQMVAAFRVFELQMLLQYANKNKSGKKTELQARAMELLRRAVHSHNVDLCAKIRELHRQRYAGGGDTSTANQQENVGYVQQSVPQHYTSMPVLSTPRAADVTFKTLPFYELIDEPSRRVLFVSSLAARITARGARDPQHTHALVREKLRPDADADIATMSLKAALLCPLGKMRMAFPVRPTTCQHIQCFDGRLFLQMNEKRAAWTCPVCDGPALFADLLLDGMFADILARTPATCEQVEFDERGEWRPLVDEPQVAEVKKSRDLIDNDVITLSDSDDDDDQPSSSSTNLYVSSLPIDFSSSSGGATIGIVDHHRH